MRETPTGGPYIASPSAAGALGAHLDFIPRAVIRHLRSGVRVAGPRAGGLPLRSKIGMVCRPFSSSPKVRTSHVFGVAH